VDDAAALKAFHLCSRLEGILPALETAHAVVEAMKIASRRAKDEIIVICFSGRGDKDCYEVAPLEGDELWTRSTHCPATCGRAARKRSCRSCRPATRTWRRRRCWRTR